MSLYTRLVSSVFFPLHERLKGHSSVSAKRSLEKTQWLTPGEIEQIQLDRLRAFMQRINADVPYYRALFQQYNFDPQSITSTKDLQRLPLTGKAEIRANIEAMTAQNAGPLERFSTGGSSGEPLVFYRGKERVSHDVAAKWRATRWWDVDIGDPEIVVWGSPIELNSQDRVRLVRDKILRTELLSAFEMSNANLLRFTQQIRAMRPKMVFGYPSSLALLSEYARTNGYRLDDLGVKVVFVTSERLYDYQRAAIEEAFACPVANGYGSRDAGFTAHACPSGGMHITAEDMVVEIVDEDGNALPSGEKGEIVVTHLCTGDFPFVRYPTGDVGSLCETLCECGRGLPLLAEIDGRTTDFIRAADGTVLHGLAFIYVLREMESLDQFKIIQDSLTQLTVQLVTGLKNTTDIERTITEQFRRRLGDSLVVKFEYLSNIERETSGKFRYVVSNLESNLSRQTAS